MTPSEFMRQCINMGIASQRTVEKYIAKTMKYFYTEEDFKEIRNDSTV